MDKNTNWQLATGLKGLNQLPIGEPAKLTKQEVLGCDIALTQYEDLIVPTFRKWYCKAFYTLGHETFARCASQARADGKHPPKLFSYLIRKNLKQKDNIKDRLAGGAPQTGPINILTEKSA